MHVFFERTKIKCFCAKGAIEVKRGYKIGVISVLAVTLIGPHIQFRLKKD